jgi:tRNA threonylcarbamoyladenosine biosynthesis protein TsaB
MKLLLDTSTPVCHLTLVDTEGRYEYEWQADRTLADGLLGYVVDRLKEHQADLKTLTGIAVMKGPGSFTGLRIGLTVMNTLADALHIPIIGETGTNWHEAALKRLDNGEDDRLVMPEYGSAANITTPRK